MANPRLKIGEQTARKAQVRGFRDALPARLNQQTRHRLCWAARERFLDEHESVGARQRPARCLPGREDAAQRRNLQEAFNGLGAAISTLDRVEDIEFIFVWAVKVRKIAVGRADQTTKGVEHSDG